MTLLLHTPVTASRTEQSLVLFAETREAACPTQQLSHFSSLTNINLQHIHLAVAKCSGDVCPRPELRTVLHIPNAPLIVAVARPLRGPIVGAIKCGH